MTNNDYAEYPVHRAAVKGDFLEIVQLVDFNHHRVNEKDDAGVTALHCAAFGDSYKAAVALLYRGACVNARNNNDATPLHYATTFCPCSCKMVELLIANRADVNAKDNDGRTPLHGAASLNEHKIVELLIAKGADVNAKNKDGETPLHYAVVNDARETAELLIAKGADVNAKDNDGWTPLQIAVKADAEETAALLRKPAAAAAPSP